MIAGQAVTRQRFAAVSTGRLKACGAPHVGTSAATMMEGPADEHVNPGPEESRGVHTTRQP